MDARSFNFADDEKPEVKPAPIKDLGWENGWGREYPPEYRQHVEGNTRQDPHDVTSSRIGRCQTRYTCRTCGITWAVDSSD